MIAIRRVYEFATNDFKKRYAGSKLGVLWAYIQTLMIVVIYWGVFQFGFRAESVNDVPFLSWFISGLMPWLLFSEIITTTMGCMFEYNYIVKKVVFDINIIPAAKIFVCLFVHSFFLAIVILVSCIQGLFSGWYLLQLVYYMVALIMIAIPLAYLGCTICAFLRDIPQMISIALNMLMWATPIVWDMNIVPNKYHFIFKLNPIYYIIEGFRDSIVFKQLISTHILYSIYFWVIVCFLWFVCFKMYKKLAPYLADVL